MDDIDADYKGLKLLAFNLFASQVREATKEQYPEANGNEIKRIVGRKWAKLAMEEKKEFLDVAKVTAANELAEKTSVDASAPVKRRRRRRTKAEMEADGARHPLKRRRGRPRKIDVNGGEEDGCEVTLAIEQHKPRKPKEIIGVPKPFCDPACVGKSVTGVLDGSFDAGYLVSVRVAESNTILRGVLFEPTLTLPVSAFNDVAPGVKLVKKDERLVFPTPTHPTIAVPPINSSSTAVSSVHSPSSPPPVVAVQSPPFRIVPVQRAA